MARPILERIDATDVTSVRSSAGESVGPLLSELGDRVHLPGPPGYRASLARVFFPDASRRHPPCVVRPHTADDVAATLRRLSDCDDADSFLAPVIADFGSPPWLTLFLSQVASTALPQWAFIPLAWLGFRRWMDPVDGRGLGISVRGAVAMVILYAVILAVFANVTWLEYWRH